MRCLAWICASLGLCLPSTIAASEFPRFEGITIDGEIGKVCYAVATTDVNGDGRPDIVAVSENRVQWYENPTWTKHVIIEDQTERDNVCIAPYDIDGDGRIDFALGAGWTKIGTIQWISRTADPNAKWRVHFIGQETSLHRMSFADVLGTGRPQLVISPLQKSVAEGVRFSAFTIPADPRSDRWTQTVLDQSLTRMHNHTHLEWDRQPGIESIVAAEQGVYLISRNGTGEFHKTLLGTGIAGTTPETRGAGEIKVGRWNPSASANNPSSDLRSRFLATVEPMHGHAAVVYLPPGFPGGGAAHNGSKDSSLTASTSLAASTWQRVVLDDTLKQGHAVWTADLNGDGRDEVVIGHREPGPGPVKGPGLYVFEAASADGTKWTKHIVDDGGCAVEDALAIDLDGDGRLDLVAGGRATHNVKVYWNRGVKK